MTAAGGLYRTIFNVSPEKAEGQRIHLVFQAVGSAVMVWIDGQHPGCNEQVQPTQGRDILVAYVGYSQDSMTAAEFDITEVLKAPKKQTDGGAMHDRHSSNATDATIAVRQDQDQWWLSGIHRPVELHFDYTTETVLEEQHALLKITCQVSGAAEGSVDISDGQLRVNGQAITVAGANVHEMHPTRGKALTEEDMLIDIKRL
eukprot:Skav204728  [mRNA]  locus=scaffold1549:245683:249651:+ [translate_table: standard]